MTGAVRAFAGVDVLLQAPTFGIHELGAGEIYQPRSARIDPADDGFQRQCQNGGYGEVGGYGFGAAFGAEAASYAANRARCLELVREQ